MQSQRPPGAGVDPNECGCDRDMFLRVWDRVMPEEREACPIAVPRCDQMMPVVRDAGNDFPPREDVPCLGSAAAADQEQLREFVSRELQHWQEYRVLAQRSCQGSRMLAALAGNCRRRAKRLSAALFLISNVRYWPAEQVRANMPRSWFGALREQFLAEQNRGCAYRAAAEDCRDMCLRQLYLDLAQESTEHAGCIRSLIENM